MSYHLFPCKRERGCANLLIDREKITVYDNRTSPAWRTPQPRAQQPAILFHEDFMNELDPSEYECLQEFCSDTFNSRSSSFMSHISFSHYFFCTLSVFMAANKQHSRVRRRRWSNIKPALCKCLIFSGYTSLANSINAEGPVVDSYVGLFYETQWPWLSLFSPSWLIQWSMGEGSYITLFLLSDVIAFHRMKYGRGGVI